MTSKLPPPTPDGNAEDDWNPWAMTAPEAAARVLTALAYGGGMECFRVLAPRMTAERLSDDEARDAIVLVRYLFDLVLDDDPGRHQFRRALLPVLAAEVRGLRLERDRKMRALSAVWMTLRILHNPPTGWTTTPLEWAEKLRATLVDLDHRFAALDPVAMLDALENAGTKADAPFLTLGAWCGRCGAFEVRPDEEQTRVAGQLRAATYAVRETPEQKHAKQERRRTRDRKRAK